MKRAGLMIIISLLALGACHRQAPPLVFFSQKSGKPPLWVSDHNYWYGQKTAGAIRNALGSDRAKDWATETDSMTSPALKISKTEFAFMRKTLKEKVCGEALKRANDDLILTMMTNKKFRTETYWTEYTQGNEGHMNLIVHYHCMVEGVHKYGMGDLQ